MKTHLAHPLKRKQGSFFFLPPEEWSPVPPRTLRRWKRQRLLWRAQQFPWILPNYYIKHGEVTKPVLFPLSYRLQTVIKLLPSGEWERGTNSPAAGALQQKVSLNKNTDRQWEPEGVESRRCHQTHTVWERQTLQQFLTGRTHTHTHTRLFWSLK